MSFTICEKLHPRVKLEVTDRILDQRDTLAEIEAARMLAGDLVSIPLDKPHSKKVAPEPMDFYPAPCGTSEWRKPGTRFVGKSKPRCKLYAAH